MATISDVARHAGVSVSTVSYALSGKRPISPHTRRRVLDSVVALDYRPPATTRSRAIGLAVGVRGGAQQPLLAEFMLSASVAARRHDCNLLLLTDHEGRDTLFDSAVTARLDGLVLMDIRALDPRVETARRLPLPTVLIGLPREPAGLPCVDLDFHASARLCVDHLADAGHREIVLIGGPPELYRRRAGFAERTVAGALAQAQARGVRLAHRACEGTWEGTARVVERVLEERPRATALVVQNDTALPHVVPLLRSLGRSVPGDVSVVSLGSDAVATAGRPEITAVAVPASDMTARAVDLLVERLDGRRGEDPCPPLLLRPRLTVRASSGPAPA